MKFEKKNLSYLLRIVKMLSKKKILIYAPKNSSEDKCRGKSCQSIIVEYPAWFGCASYKDHFVQRQFRTRLSISKAQESLRTRFFCTRWYLNFYMQTPRSHFVQIVFPQSIQHSLPMVDFPKTQALGRFLAIYRIVEASHN